MTATKSHRLDGLEPDNLLAFLALLGLLRALEISRRNWRPRVHWDMVQAPLRPILTTRDVTTHQDVSEAVLEGLQVFQKALRPFSWPRTKQGNSKKRALLANPFRQRSLSKRCIRARGASEANSEKRAIWELRCDLIAGSGGSRVDRKKKDAFDVSPMKLPSGQMTFIGAQFDAISACHVEDIRKCLFQTWTYGHKGNSLRFSPVDAQRYAYLASDPSPEGSRTELGASALAGLGLLNLTMSEGRPRWRMVAYAGSRSEGKVCWPIWGAEDGVGASFQMILAMLRTLAPDAQQHPSIRHLVPMIASARRYVLDPKQGDYGNVTRAELSFTTERS